MNSTERRKRRKLPRRYELIIGSTWEQYVNGRIYDIWDQEEKEYREQLNASREEAFKAISDEIDKQILDELQTVAGAQDWDIDKPRKLDCIWNPALEYRIEPTYIVSPVRITPSVEITPDEMKSDLWQRIANPILHNLRLSHPVQAVPSLWDLKGVRISSLPATSTLRMSPSTYQSFLPYTTLKKASSTEKESIILSSAPEWYSVEDYPEPLTYGSILTNNDEGVIF